MKESPPPLPLQQIRANEGQPIIPAPKGMVWFGDVKVAGTQFEGRSDVLRALAREDPESQSWILIPTREQDNKYDKNAIAVLATKGKQEHHLGYLPKQVAAHLRNYKRIGLAPRSIAKDGRYFYVDVFHSEKESSGCLGCLPLIVLCISLIFPATEWLLGLTT